MISAARITIATKKNNMNGKQHTNQERETKPMIFKNIATTATTTKKHPKLKSILTKA
jgi:hypothetical protein